MLLANSESRSCDMWMFFYLCWKSMQIFSVQISLTWKLILRKCVWDELGHSNCRKQEKCVDQTGKMNLLGN